MEEKKQEQTLKFKEKVNKTWLDRLKEESWEAELLVSAIAIFGTFQLFSLIKWITNFFINNLADNQYLIGYGIVFFGLFAVSILVSMFVIHFFLRAYWIGLVGLNSVFPNYSTKNSAYSKIYTGKILSIIPKSKDTIKKVDELCSVIFSVAFTFLIIYCFIGLTSSVYLWIYNLLLPYISHYILLIPFMFIGLLFFIQLALTIFANKKSNHHKEKLQEWNFKVFKLTAIITYGPIYKPITQVVMLFGSNFKKKKSMIFLIFSFLIFGVITSLYQMFNTNIPYLINPKGYFDSSYIESNHYEVFNAKNDFLLAPEIKSDIVKEPFLKVFIPIFNNETISREALCGFFKEDKNKTSEEQRKNRRQHTLDCYHKYNVIFLNGESVKVEYKRYYHFRTNQFGVLTYLDLTGLKKGKNILEVKKVFSDENTKEWVIPFYYIPNSI